MISQTRIFSTGSHVTPESLGILGIDCYEFSVLVFFVELLYRIMGLWGLSGSNLTMQLPSTAIRAACGQRGWMERGGCKGGTLGSMVQAWVAHFVTPITLS